VGPREFYTEVPSTQGRAIELAGAEESPRLVVRTYRAVRSEMERLRRHSYGEGRGSIRSPLQSPPGRGQAPAI
jgi:hypothetical protein